MSRDCSVVITGMGVCSPAGFGSDALATLLRSGECRVAPITRFDVSGYRSAVGAEVPPEAEEEAVRAGRSVGLQVTPRYGRAALYGLGALAEALQSAGLAGEDFAEPENWNPDSDEKPPRLLVKESKKMAALKRGDRVLARNEETERGWRATPIKKLPARSEAQLGCNL